MIQLVLHLLHPHRQEFLSLKSVGPEIIPVAGDQDVDRVQEVLHPGPMEIADDVVLAAEIDDESRPRDLPVVVVWFPRAALENFLCVQRLFLEMIEGFDGEVVQVLPCFNVQIGSSLDLGEGKNWRYRARWRPHWTEARVVWTRVDYTNTSYT